ERLEVVLVRQSITEVRVSRMVKAIEDQRDGVDQGAVEVEQVSAERHGGREPTRSTPLRTGAWLVRRGGSEKRKTHSASQDITAASARPSAKRGARGAATMPAVTGVAAGGLPELVHCSGARRVRSV